MRYVLGEGEEMREDKLQKSKYTTTETNLSRC